MSDLAPLDDLYDAATGTNLPLPPALARIYGRFAVGSHRDRPWVIGNFVSTLDGVVSLSVPGKSGGSDISGGNPHDRVVMGILRAVSDAVIVGAGTFRAVPNHVWTAEYIYPTLAPAYEQLRAAIGKSESLLNVIVTGSGEVDLQRPVFTSGQVAVLIVTTPRGQTRLQAKRLPESTKVVAVADQATISPRALLDAISEYCPSDLFLCEGGPHLIGDFFARGLLDDLFLTIAPQIAGRLKEPERPGLVAGHAFAPDHPLWGNLVSLKRAESHLFLRYSFGAPPRRGDGGG